MSARRYPQVDGDCAWQMVVMGLWVDVRLSYLGVETGIGPMGVVTLTA